MPKRDGTGPMGQGAMTGYRLGNCRYDNMDFSYGRGAGRGYNCRRSNIGGALTKDFLASQKEMLENRLNKINKLLNQ